MKKLLFHSLFHSIMIAFFWFLLLGIIAGYSMTGDDLHGDIIETEQYKIVMEGSTPAIYLASSIEKPNDYRGLISFINSHKDVSDMKLYLSGNGGNVASVINLVETIKSSPTKFHIHVYGDVYSAHAFLALAGSSLTFASPSINLLFHGPAFELAGEYIRIEDSCALESGKDRGIPKEQKCRDYVKHYMDNFNEVLLKPVLSYLTKEEYQRYLAGDDVIITAQDMYNRGLKH